MKIKECYLTLTDIKFCHTSYLPELCTYTKDTTVEMALSSTHNTHKRRKIGHFRFLMQFSCAYIYLIYVNKHKIKLLSQICMLIIFIGGWILQ